MSIQEGEVLEDLIWLVRSLYERVAALEERQPTWASGNLSHADIAARLARLARAAAAISGNAPTSPADAGVRDPPQAAKLPGPTPGNAPPVAHGAALRAAIADILETEPAATGPMVLERLRAAYAGTLPTDRTIRWHLRALRGNGNTRVLPPPA